MSESPPLIAYWLELGDTAAPSAERPEAAGHRPEAVGPTDPSASEGPGPPAGPDRQPAHPPPRWGWALAALLFAAALGLPGSGPVSPAALAFAAAPARGDGSDRGPGGRPALEEGEWVRLAGVAVGGPAPPPGWSLQAPPPADALAGLPLAGLTLSPAPAEGWPFGPPPAGAGLAGPPCRLCRPLTPGPRAPSPRGPAATGQRGAAPPSAPLPPQRVTLPPPLDGRSHDRGPAAVVDGVNYADPVGVGLPLLRAGGLEYVPVSAHFRVGDFATHDGAAYVRIAPDLVAGLERMRGALGPLTVISGYRHPRYNARPAVGGAPYSRHQSGQAADVYVHGRSTVEVARAAVEAMGCGIGLGLGRNTIHVDVRGSLSTWTYRGAPLSRAVFDRWVRALCGGAAPAAPSERPLSPAEVWLARGGDDGAHSDGEELVHLASPDAVADAGRAAEAGPDGPGLAPALRAALSAFAVGARGRVGPGAVVVDLRGPDAGGPDGPAARYVRAARYVAAGGREARELGLGPLLAWVSERADGAYFAYAVRHPDGRVESGVAPTEPDPDGPGAPTASGSDWLVLIASEGDIESAERALERHRAPLRGVGLGAVLRAGAGPDGPRYDVVVGPFPTSSDAERALAQARTAAPADARVVRAAL